MKIEFKNVNFGYSKKIKVLDNINLCFDRNEIVFIMGHTGSGKSTLVQHLNGLLFCDEGEVVIEVKNKIFHLNKQNKIKNINELRKNMGLVFQFSEYQLFETTVIRDVMFGPLNFFRDEKKAREMAIKALNKVGIGEEYYERSPFELSGGEKRKVAIAGVLASNPEVIVLDEPTSSLDKVATREFMNLVRTLKEEGKLVIIISHDADLCYEYADRLIVMEKGKIICDKSNLDEVFSNEELVNKASLVVPFVCKVKQSLNIKNKDIRNLDKLKEVIGK